MTAPEFAELVKNALWIRSIYPKLEPEFQMRMKEDFDCSISLILQELGRRVCNSDASFFIDLGGIMARDREKKLPAVEQSRELISTRVQEYVTAQVEGRKAFELPLPTPNELYKDLAQSLKIPVSKKTVERLFKKLKVGSKKGRPKKSDS